MATLLNIYESCQYLDSRRFAPLELYVWSGALTSHWEMVSGIEMLGAVRKEVRLSND